MRTHRIGTCRIRLLPRTLQEFVTQPRARPTAAGSRDYGMLWQGLPTCHTGDRRSPRATPGAGRTAVSARALTDGGSFGLAEKVARTSPLAKGGYRGVLPRGDTAISGLNTPPWPPLRKGGKAWKSDFFLRLRLISMRLCEKPPSVSPRGGREVITSDRPLPEVAHQPASASVFFSESKRCCGSLIHCTCFFLACCFFLAGGPNGAGGLPKAA
jgi:hypothetical protein